MELTITRIGNSDGIILSKAFMKKHSLRRADVLVVDEDSPDIVLKKKTPAIEYAGPNTGFFSALAHHDTADDTSWGGVLSSEDYLAGIRADEAEKEIQEGWR